MSTITCRYAVNGYFSTQAPKTTQVTEEELKANPNQKKRLITLLHCPKDVDVRTLLYKERITVLAFIINLLILPIVAVLAAFGWVFARSSQFTAQQIERMVQLFQGSWIAYDTCALSLLRTIQTPLPFSIEPLVMDGENPLSRVDQALFVAEDVASFEAALRVGANPDVKIPQEEGNYSRIEWAFQKDQKALIPHLLSKLTLDERTLNGCFALATSKEAKILLVKAWLKTKRVDDKDAELIAPLIVKVKEQGSIAVNGIVFTPVNGDYFTVALHTQTTTLEECEALCRYGASETIENYTEDQKYSLFQSALLRGQIEIAKHYFPKENPYLIYPADDTGKIEAMNPLAEKQFQRDMAFAFEMCKGAEMARFLLEKMQEGLVSCKTICEARLQKEGAPKSNVSLFMSESIPLFEDIASDPDFVGRTLVNYALAGEWLEIAAGAGNAEAISYLLDELFKPTDNPLFASDEGQMLLKKMKPKISDCEQAITHKSLSALKALMFDATGEPREVEKDYPYALYMCLSGIIRMLKEKSSEERAEILQLFRTMISHGGVLQEIEEKPGKRGIWIVSMLAVGEEGILGHEPNEEDKAVFDEFVKCLFESINIGDTSKTSAEYLVHNVAIHKLIVGCNASSTLAKMIRSAPDCCVFMYKQLLRTFSSTVNEDWVRRFALLDACGIALPNEATIKDELMGSLMRMQAIDESGAKVLEPLLRISNFREYYLNHSVMWGATTSGEISYSLLGYLMSRAYAEYQEKPEAYKASKLREAIEYLKSEKAEVLGPTDENFARQVEFCKTHA